MSDGIRQGRKILKKLKAEGVPLEGAYWLHDSDYDSWRLVLASRDARLGARQLLMRAARTLEPADMLSIQFVAPEDGMYQAVSKAHGVPQSFGRRIRFANIDGRYIDDAFVYTL